MLYINLNMRSYSDLLVQQGTKSTLSTLNSLARKIYLLSSNLGNPVITCLVNEGDYTKHLDRVVASSQFSPFDLRFTKSSI
jgi:hypothetical protein